MRALITGITGQDGSYLAEQLVEQGHDVFGLLRGQFNPKRKWLESLVPSIQLVEGDLLDQSSLVSALQTTNPDVVYNLGAVTFVGLSWTQPTLMSEVTGLGCLRMLEAIRMVNPNIRFVQASSSEMFGDSGRYEYPQNESTRLQPRSPYGTAKAFAHHTTVNYRDSFNIRASTVIMFNHESPRRGEEFVTRKVSKAVSRIVHGEQATLSLGNLESSRDWGWAEEYMKALPLISGADSPSDYIIATGETHTVRDLCQVAFDVVDLDYHDYLVTDPELYRPADVEMLCGDGEKIKKHLGWEPKIKFTEIVRRLVEHDLNSHTH